MRTTRKKTRTSSALLALLLISSVAADAQKKKTDDTNSRNVQGVVLDAKDNPVPHAVVQLEDSRTLQVRSFISLDDGSYHFSGLKADVDYRIKAEYKDMMSAAKTFSVFDSRKTGVYNLKLEKAKPPEQDKK
jgi:hypothetical protein